jgi:hypothetical protein
LKAKLAVFARNLFALRSQAPDTTDQFAPSETRLKSSENCAIAELLIVVAPDMFATATPPVTPFAPLPGFVYDIVPVSGREINRVDERTIVEEPEPLEYAIVVAPPLMLTLQPPLPPAPNVTGWSNRTERNPPVESHVSESGTGAVPPALATPEKSIACIRLIKIRRDRRR